MCRELLEGEFEFIVVGLGFVGIECGHQRKHMQQGTVGLRLILLCPEVKSGMVGTEHG